MADPDTIAGLVGWWDASTLTGYSDGQTVDPWTDRSGNGHELDRVGAGTGLYQANEVNGLAAVSFISTTVFNEADFLLDLVNPFTIFYVARKDGVGNRAITFSFGGVNWLLGPYGGTWQWYSGGFASAGKVATNGELIIHGVRQEAASGTHYVYEAANETAAVTGTRASPNSPGKGFGFGNNSPNSEGFNGVICEAVAYNNAISPTDQAALVAYFRYKWAGVGPAPEPPAPPATAGGNRMGGSGAIRRPPRPRN